MQRAYDEARAENNNMTPEELYQIESCGLLLTPRSNEASESVEAFRDRMNSKRKNDRKDGYGSLSMQVLDKYKHGMLPTPQARDMPSVCKLIPTPRTSDSTGSPSDPTYFDGREDRKQLRDYFVHNKLLNTPVASDSRDRGHMGNPAVQRRVEKGKQISLSMQVRDSSDVRLNPEFVREMMGFPQNWFTETVKITQRDDVELLQYPESSPVIPKDQPLDDNAARLKALGNAVVPQIPEIIGRFIMQIEKENVHR